MIYNNLYYNDDCTKCMGPACPIKIAVLHPNTKTIAERAFYHHEELEEVIFNDNLEYILPQAFLGTSIKNIELKDVNIKRFAFSEIKTLENVEIKAPCIPNFCFFKSNIKKLMIDTDTIGNSAFRNSKITTAEFKNVLSVYDEAFSGAKFLQDTIIFPATTNYIFLNAFAFTKLERAIFLAPKIDFVKSNLGKDITTCLLFNEDVLKKNEKYFEDVKTEKYGIDNIIEENRNFKEIVNIYKEINLEI